MTVEELCESLKNDGFDEVICNRLLEHYRQTIISIDDVPTRKQAVADFKHMSELMMEEYKAKEEATRIRREIEETERHDMAMRTNWEAKLSTFVGNNIISTLDVIEELYPMLSKEQQEHYYNIPAYATYDLKGSDIFDRAYNSCIEKYRRSQGIKAKVNQYLAAQTNDESMYPYHMDRLISCLPDFYDMNEDPYVLAYKAICILEDSKSTAESVDLSKQKDIMKEQYIKQIKAGDPAEVASRGSVEVGLSALGKSIGKTVAYPKYVTQTFKNAVGIGQNELLSSVVPPQQTQTYVTNASPVQERQHNVLQQTSKFSIWKFALILVALFIGWQFFKALPIIKMIGAIVLVVAASVAYKLISK